MLNHSNGSSTADVDIEHLSDFIKEKLLPLHSQYLLDKQTKIQFTSTSDNQ